MYEVHSGVCDAHAKDASEAQTDGVLLAYNGPELYGLCETLQHEIYGDSMPNPLRPTVASWPIFLFLLCASTKLTCRAYEKENLFLNHTPLAPVPLLKKKAIVAASP